MIQQFPKMLCVASLLAFLSVGLSDRLGAQDLRSREIARRVSVTVAVTDSFTYAGTAAVILRRPNLLPHDVILLPASESNGTALAAAAVQLLLIRDRAGDTPTTASVFRIRKSDPASHLLEREVGTAGTILDRLRTKPLRTVPGVAGTVRSTEIYLPSEAMRNELKTNKRLSIGSRR